MSLLSFLHTIVRPTLLAPAVRVQSIRNLDFAALKQAGYRGVVFDKDNCLTIPNEDRLVPQLHRAWNECRRTFDAGHVVVVSNSAGTREDVSGLEAESVSYHLQVPVLFHDIHKPGCRDVILQYYATLTTSHPSSFSYRSSSSSQPLHNTLASEPMSQPPIKPSELIVVGDRLFTDVLMGNKLGALTVWTQGLWKRELMPMRFFEKSILWVLDAVEARRHSSQGRDINPAQSPQAAFAKADMDVLRPSREAPTGRLTSTLKKGYHVGILAVRWLASRLMPLRTPSSPTPPREPATQSGFRALPARGISSLKNVTASLLKKGSTIASTIARRGWLRVHAYSTERLAPLRSVIPNVWRSVKGRRTG